MNEGCVPPIPASMIRARTTVKVSASLSNLLGPGFSLLPVDLCLTIDFYLPYLFSTSYGITYLLAWLRVFVLRNRTT